MPAAPDGQCQAGGISVKSASGTSYVCNGLPGAPGSSGGGTPDTDDSSYQTPKPISTAQDSNVTTLTTVATLPLGAGGWAIIAKATATGAGVIDCLLMPHSTTISLTGADAIDETTVNASSGPTAIVTAGLLTADADITGVDLVCSATSSVIVVQQRIVGHMGDPHTVGKAGP